MAKAARIGDPCDETAPAAPRQLKDVKVPTVFIGNEPCAVAGGQVPEGSKTVKIGNASIVRVGDTTVTGGSVRDGCNSVEVG